jgi:hypothetical protein
VLRPSGRRSPRSWFTGVDDRERRLTCSACGWTYGGGADPAQARTLPELTAHDCAAPGQASRRRWPLALLALLLLAAVAAGAFVLTRERSGAATVAEAGPPRALLLSGSSLSYDGATRAAAVLGWDATVFSLPGIGFSRSILDAEQSLLRSSRELLPAEPPDVLVVQGGEADHTAPRAVLTAAVQELIAEVGRRTGGATQLVLVGPIPGEQVPDSLRRVNDVLAAQAAERDVPYVDAVRLGLRTGDPALPDLLAQELARVLGDSATDR